MDDLISRQAAIDAIEFGITYAKKINKETGEVSELFQEGNAELRKAVERVKELPSAQPEREKGRWILDQKSGRRICSECLACASRDDFGKEYLSDYCTVCGADMRGVTS